MTCPACATGLHMTERHGVEIDYCPKCRGVWLDRGELDKVIERSRVAETRGSDYDERREHHLREEHRYTDREHQYDPRHKKKKSFLDDLFDFG